MARDARDVGRRFFIGLGTGRYRDLPEVDQLPQVATDIASMREVWAGFGYTPVLLGLGEYDSAAQIQDKLSLWSAHAGLTDDDVVVLYFAGHGVSADRDRHYLLCWDSREGEHAATALRTERLVEILCRGELRHLLIVLDTCAGAAGGAEATTTALHAIAYATSSSDAGAGLWFLASARRKDVADDGAFVAGLRKAVQVVTDRTGQRQRYLDLADLVNAVNEGFANVNVSQRAELAGGLITGLAPFIPNKGFRDDLPPVGTDLEIQRRIAGQDLDEHFGPRSRGVEFESEQGLYFSGREQVLVQLVAWLTAPEGDGKGRVVTGSPGCGKSAVLGRIVAPSIGWYRARLDLSDVNPATVVPESNVTAAVHARHKRLEEIVGRIAEALGIKVDGTAALLQELSRRGKNSSRPVVVVIDALDEAGSGTAADTGGRGEPRKIARELLRPMSEIPGVRLLVGTRRELVSGLGPTVTLDLDKPEYRSDDDVAGYVRKVLLAAREPEIVTPYRGRVALADLIAKGVARRAAGVFLVARMTARSLRLRDSPIDVLRVDWMDSLPSEIGSAFDDFLARFGDAEPRVRRMLLPLAFAEGHGLPRGQIWSRIGSVLSGVDCAEEDITWILNMAQAYIAEVVDGDRSAYRLYHQALAEHLRETAGQAAERIQELIVEALISTVPVSADRQAPDWFAAAPYVRQHLATHARASGQLENLIRDPGLLLASGQLALQNALPSITSDAGRRIRTAYEQAAHRLRPDRALVNRTADLQLSARRCGADALADRIGTLGVPLPWLANWAWWSSTGAHRQLTGHTEPVLCVATANLDDRPIAVTGSWDHTARIWDIVTQQQIGKPLLISVAVSAVAVGDLGDYTIALIGGVDGGVRIWDLSAAQEYGDSLTGHTNRINAIAVREVDGKTIVLTASGDGTARIWDLRTRTQIGPALTAHRRTVRAAALGEVEGMPVAVTGGDDRRVYVWNLNGIHEGEEARVDGRPLIGFSSEVSAVALADRDGQSMAVVGDDAGMLSLWDLASRQQIGEPVAAHVYHVNSGVRSVSIGQFSNSEAVLTSGAYDARLWDLNGLRQLGHPLRGHVKLTTGAALTAGGDRPMAVTVSLDQTARVWDITAAQPATGHVKSVLAVAAAEIGGQTLAISGGSDGTARLWDLQSRMEIGRPMEGHAGNVSAVALAFSSDGSAIAVTGGSDATIRLWDPMRGYPIGAPLEGHTNAVACLCMIKSAERQIAVTGSEDGTVRLWDIGVRAQLGTPLIGHIGAISHVAARNSAGGIEIVVATSLDHAYLWRVSAEMTQAIQHAHFDLAAIESTAEIVGVAFDGEQAVVLAAHGDNNVHAYDIRTSTAVGMTLVGHKSIVVSAASGRLGNEMAIATLGFDGIRLWKLQTGEQIGQPLRGDVRYQLSSFAFAQTGGLPVGLATFYKDFRAYDLTSMEPLGEPLCGNSYGINSVAIEETDSGPVAVTTSEDAVVRTHAILNGRQVAAHITSDSRGGNISRALSTVRVDGDMFALVGLYDAVEIWNLTSRQQVGTFRGHSGIVSCIAVCSIADRVTVVTGSDEAEVVVWDLLTRVSLSQSGIGHTAEVKDVAARIIGGKPIAASASLDGTVRLWDLKTGQSIADPFGGYVRGATAVDLGAFGNREVVLVGTQAGRIVVRDVVSHELLDLQLEPHQTGIAAVRLRRLGDRFVAVAADYNGLIRAWDLRAAVVVAEVNVDSGIRDMEMTFDGDLCVATSMGLVALRLDLPGDVDGR